MSKEIPYSCPLLDELKEWFKNHQCKANQHETFSLLQIVEDVRLINYSLREENGELKFELERNKVNENNNIIRELRKSISLFEQSEIVNARNFELMKNELERMRQEYILYRQTAVDYEKLLLENKVNITAIFK